VDTDHHGIRCRRTRTTGCARRQDSFPEPTIPGPPTAPLRILSIGRLVPKKGYPDQIQLYVGLHNAGVPFEAVLIGDGPLRVDLQKLIRTSALPDRVRLIGALPYSEVEQHFRRADLFLFTGIVSRDGDRDGLPNVVAEAMSHGIPVAARPAPGICEAVRDDETGLLLKGDRPEDWTKQIMNYWNDTEKRRRVSAAARLWVEEYFSTRKNTHQLADAIRASMETAP